MICFCEKETTAVYIQGDFADPLWCYTCNANLEICQIASIELARQFHHWNAQYGEWIQWENEDAPYNAEQVKKVNRFNEEGKRLTALLQLEKDATCTIRYEPVIISYT